METWKKVWREGFAPQLSDRGLQALRDALERDDPRLIQGATTSPPPLACVTAEPPEGACAVSYCGWVGEQLKTIGEVEEFFGQACFACDQALGEAAACRWFLNYFDETPRAQMRFELVGEVELELESRATKG